MLKNGKTELNHEAFNGDTRVCWILFRQIL